MCAAFSSPSSCCLIIVILAAISDRDKKLGKGVKAQCVATKALFDSKANQTSNVKTSFQPSYNEWDFDSPLAKCF